MLLFPWSALASTPAPEFEQALADGRLGRARFLATDALREAPSDPDRWVALARATDDPAEAEPLLAEALRLRPTDPDITVAHARALASLGDTFEAVTELRTLSETPDVLVALAEVQRDPELARRALVLAPGHAGGARALARLTDDAVEARSVLDAVMSPDRTVLAARVEQAIRARDLLGAQTALTALAAVDPDASETLALAAWVRCLEHDASLPIAELLDARLQAMIDPLHPPDASAVAALAPRCAAAQALVGTLAATTHGRIHAWTRAVGLSPENVRYLRALGRELLEAGRAEEARAYLEQAQEEAVPPTDLARALLALGDEDAARRLLADAALRFPDDPEVALVRADAEADPERALEFLLESLERTSDGRVLERARTLADALEQTDALSDVLRGPGRAPLLDDDVSEEIVVVWKDSEDRLAEIVGKLRTLGYHGRPHRRGDGIVHLDAEGMDRPAVTLHPDGLYEVQRAGLVPVKKTPWLEDSRTTLQVVSEQKLRQGRERVMTALQPELGAWRAALRSEGFEARLADVSSELDRVWLDGLASDGSTLASAAERRAELLELWVTRACTPEGDTVRGRVATYLRGAVQRSPWPVTEAELSALNARRPCALPLVLEEPP